MRDFDREIESHQVEWRRGHIANQEYGEQRGVERQWILPQYLWQEGLWIGLRDVLPQYLANTGVQKHDGVHNLKSSWMLCANMYFPFRDDLRILAGFLREKVSPQIESLEKIELEWAEEPPLDPTNLLGEPRGQRGKNQTSPDIAFFVNRGKGIILTENKFTEHSFYGCSGRDKQYGNPDARRCMDFKNVFGDKENQCYQLRWADGDRTNRKYWDYIRFAPEACQTFRRCPAATAGYQLFRQQALAEALVQSGKYNLAISCVAYDALNQTLLHCLHGTGIEDFAKGWGPLFDGRAGFATFTHQQWVGWVKDHDNTGRWSGWLGYIQERYGY